MKKLLTILTLSAYLVNIPLGNTDTTTQAVHINKGDPAPFEGYLITPSKAIDLRNLSIDNDTNKKVNTNLTEENTILTQRLQASQQQDDYLSKQLVETRDSSFFSKAGFFIFGALVTGAVSYGVYKSK